MPFARRALAAVSALALGVGGALLAATPASAITDDVVTPDWYWDDVSDDALSIGDASSYYQDFLGLGFDMTGWGNDAIDGFLEPGAFAITYGATTLTPTLTPVSSDWVDNGLSTLVASGEADFGQGVVVDVTVTLEVQGSFARWNFAFSDGASDVLDEVTASIAGDLGSDGTTAFVTVGPDGLVSYEETNDSPIVAGDAIIGYLLENATDASFDIADGNEIVGVDFAAASETTLTVGLVEADPCTATEAIQYLILSVGDFGAQFGSTLDTFYTVNCLSPAAVPALQVSAPTNQTVALTPTGGLISWFGAVFAEGDFQVMELSGLPDGLAVESVYDPIAEVTSLSITGTPTQSGVFEVELLGYFGTDAFRMQPLFLTTTITVNGLAATGADPAPSVAIAALLLLAGAGAVVVSRRLRRA